MKISMVSSSLIHLLLRGISRSQTLRARNLEKLSSGHRINRAADDAAGLSQAAGLNARIRSTIVAKRNIREGINALQIADGALGQIQDIFGRMRELIVQSASDTIDDTGRAMIQEEFAALTESVDTIAKGTKYNEFALLQQPHLDIGFLIDSSGSMDQEIIQVTNSISDFHSAFESAGFDVNFGLAECNLARDGVDALTLRNDINQTGFESALAGLTIQGGYVDPYSALLNASGANDFNNDNDSFSWRQYVSSTLILITDTNQEVHLTPGDPSQAEVAQMLADLGITVYVICDPGHIGAYNQITSLTGGTLYDKGDASGNLIPEALADIAEKSTGRSTMSITPIEVQVGIEGNEEDRLSIGLPVDATKIGLGLCGQDISTREGALEAMGVIDDAIDTVSQHRAQIGAANSRLDSILRDHETAIENETAGLSRIQDTDIAQGTGEFVRTQILAGSSTALLAQTLNMQKEFVRHLLESRNQFGLENRKNFLFNQNSYGMEILKTRKTSQGIGY